MGGVIEIIEARTITELKKKTQAWTKKVREADFDVRLGWDRSKVEKTGTRYRIRVTAHT